MGNGPGRERRRSEDAVSSGTRSPCSLARPATAMSAFTFDRRWLEKRQRSSNTPPPPCHSSLADAHLPDQLPLELALSQPRRHSGDSAGHARDSRHTLLHQHSAPARTSDDEDDDVNAETSGSSRTGDGGQVRLIPLVVEYTAPARALHVSVCASFTQWRPEEMAVSERAARGDLYMSIHNVPLGRHLYHFLVDGVRRVDLQAPQCCDEAGRTNNVREIGQQDLADCDALAMTGAAGAPSHLHHSQTSCAGSEDTTTPPGNYSQHVPAYRPWSMYTAQPPALPPHLLQVILNKDTPLSCEPTLLPAPNHVMLNHLYALSIRQGVMVLSATHRYRKKYVTTLLYKPI